MQESFPHRDPSRVSWPLLLLALLATAVLGRVCRAQSADTKPAHTGPYRVLVIGDEVSTHGSGYLSDLSSELSGHAVVLHIPGPAGSSREAASHLREWLGKEPWDLVLFNFGIHDLKNEGKEVAPLDYEKNLRGILKQFKRYQPDTKLVWATTTPVPAKNKDKCKPEDVPIYNDAAYHVMVQAHIPIADLYNAILPRLAQTQTHDVLFNNEGNKILAATAAAAIRQALNIPAPAHGGPPK
jgi:acyl-CoA thioesterase-1